MQLKMAIVHVSRYWSSDVLGTLPTAVRFPVRFLRGANCWLKVAQFSCALQKNPTPKDMSKVGPKSHKELPCRCVRVWQRFEDFLHLREKDFFLAQSLGVVSLSPPSPSLQILPKSRKYAIPGLVEIKLI